jgi:hypothetical protein
MQHGKPFAVDGTNVQPDPVWPGDVENALKVH